MAEIIDMPSSWVGYRFAEITELTDDKALFIPWEELDEYRDPAHTARVIAWLWSQRLGIKFRTRKGPAGMYIIRHGKAA